MNRRFLLWGATLIACLVVNGLCLRAIATSGVSVSESLVLRGLSCVLVVAFYAYTKKLSLLPNQPRTQMLRAFLAGLALSAISLSYLWLTASTIAMLSIIDVPLLVVLGPIVGVRTSLAVRALALLAIGILIWFITNLDVQTNLTYGLTALISGVLLLCFGYLMIKKSMGQENAAVTVLTPALALMAFGIVQRLLHSSATPWTINMLAVAAVAGLCMFGAYYATMRLYEHADLALAEFPTLLASLAIQPLEAALLREPMHLSYLICSVCFIAVVATLLRIRHFSS